MEGSSRVAPDGPAPVLGPVHLRVADSGHVLAFWEGMLGLEARTGADGRIGLRPRNGERDLLMLEVEPRASAPPRTATGLYHVALLLPDRVALGRAFLALEAVGGRRAFVGAADHAVSEALYYTDPEGNGLELYADRPRSEWKSARGELLITTEPLDLMALADAGGRPDPDDPAVAPGTILGHVHLRVENLERTGAFYRERLGMDVTVSGYPGALFLSWGGYHHHLGLNVWGGPLHARPSEGARGLTGWTIRFPGAAPGGGEDLMLDDPDGVPVRVVGA